MEETKCSLNLGNSWRWNFHWKIYWFDVKHKLTNQFIQAVLEFKNQFVEETAKTIIRRFIGNKSRTPINIPGPITDRITKASSEGRYSKEMFDEAYKEIFKLLKEDSFRRFYKSRIPDSEAETEVSLRGL